MRVCVPVCGCVEVWNSDLMSQETPHFARTKSVYLPLTLPALHMQERKTGGKGKRRPHPTDDAVQYTLGPVRGKSQEVGGGEPCAHPVPLCLRAFWVRMPQKSGLVSLVSGRETTQKVVVAIQCDKYIPCKVDSAE